MKQFIALAAIISSVFAAPTKREECCNDRSKNPEWTVHGLDYHASYIFTTPAHQNSWGYVNFNLTNTAVDYTVACSGDSDQLSDFFYGNMWYTCQTAEGTPPAYFRYDRPTGRVDLNQTWVCPDPQYPTTYGAYGNATKELTCTDTTWQNPNWTMGQIYSSRTVECNLVDLVVEPSQIWAVA
ncbi:hypothetical protein BU16DRAFT_521056 [Lophium mytilinum]|uniref:AA1-like domain-containing protein n=1 Tax=Lophium mytilinum TaxID=390894 RepID=A0A6A6RBU2_9PEZI|nr:hypothetical protein BU16DRAFT_521056 [Lophium mytilinum]